MLGKKHHAHRASTHHLPAQHHAAGHHTAGPHVAVQQGNSPVSDMHGVLHAPLSHVETTGGTVLCLCSQPAPPMRSDISALLAQRHEATPYPGGNTWVMAGSDSVEPGITASETHFTCNPVPHMNPLTAGHLTGGGPARIA